MHGMGWGIHCKGFLDFCFFDLVLLFVLGGTNLGYIFWFEEPVSFVCKFITEMGIDTDDLLIVVIIGLCIPLFFIPCHFFFLRGSHPATFLGCFVGMFDFFLDYYFAFNILQWSVGATDAESQSGFAQLHQLQLLSIIIPISVNFLFNIYLVCKMLRDSPKMGQWIRTHPFVWGLSLFFGLTSSSNLNFCCSQAMGLEMLDAPIPPRWQRRFIISGLWTHFLEDAPQLAINLLFLKLSRGSVTFECEATQALQSADAVCDPCVATFATNASLAFTFCQLLFGFTKRMYVGIATFLVWKNGQEARRDEIEMQERSLKSASRSRSRKKKGHEKSSSKMEMSEIFNTYVDGTI